MNEIKTMTAKIIGKGRTQRIVPFPQDAIVLSMAMTNEKAKEVTIEYRARVAKKVA